MSQLKKADIGISTFLASVHPADTCGTNGLPLTPNSIVIYGRFQKLKTLNHPNLCEYLDIARGKHERMVIVAEYYKTNLTSVFKDKIFRNIDVISKIAFQIASALVYLNNHDIVHRSLSLENVLLDNKGNVKLAQHGRYYMTEFGTAVDFPIGWPRYLAPEVLLKRPKHSHFRSSFKVDVWSMGIVLFQLLLGRNIWCDDVSNKCDVKTILQKTLRLINKAKETSSTFFQLLAKEHNLQTQHFPKSFISFVEQCLTVKHSERPDLTELINHEIFENFKQTKHIFCGEQFPALFRSENLELPVQSPTIAEEDADHLSQRAIKEIYHLWTLAGGDVFGELKKHGLVKTFPPVCNMPNVILHGGDTLGVAKDRNLLFDNSVVCLSFDRVRERLSNLETTAHYPLLVEKDPCAPNFTEMKTLPVVIRERDVEYQFWRIVVFQRLLDGYPYTRDKIVKEARLDIPPLLRAKVWAALLDVTGDVSLKFDSIDKDTVTATDRQIEVDIPRCHQYHQLLASPTAHGKFKRLLKAWVVSHPQLVYWQGLDSLCAPFLSLNFSNEALAYACLSAFIPKYLFNFFLKDNSHIIHEYLAVFCHLIAFHDPELFNHLDEIGFQPELYAIPWFLTMFTHVFPLQKIYHLWDTLLLGNSSFPLYVGVAILQQLRTQLLTYGFNECILLFSDMPEIDIERCVQDSIRIFQTTPKSVAARQYDNINETINGKQGPINTKKQYLPVEQLKCEKCPRISVEDLLHLLDITDGEKKVISTKSKGETTHKTKKSWGIVVDIRSPEEYDRGHIKNSLNIPCNQGSLESNEGSPSESTNILLSSKGKNIIIVGGRADNCPKFSEELLKLGFARVSVLDVSGMTTLRSMGQFFISSTG